MRVDWSDRAVADLHNIHRYIDIHNPTAAQKMMRLIASCARQLERFPELGRPSENPDIRLLQVPNRPYLLPYRVLGNRIEILAVFDERMERPRNWL
jgi:addiction module RelE/StbE family toxin